MNQHPGLATTGTSQYQHVLQRSCNDVALFIVQTIQQVGDIHHSSRNNASPGVNRGGFLYSEKRLYLLLFADPTDKKAGE